MKQCPFCAESIQDMAIKCKHCGEWLNKGAPDPSTQRIANEKRAGDKSGTASLVTSKQCPNCHMWIEPVFDKAHGNAPHCPHCGYLGRDLATANPDKSEIHKKSGIPITCSVCGTVNESGASKCECGNDLTVNSKTAFSRAPTWKLASEIGALSLLFIASLMLYAESQMGPIESLSANAFGRALGTIVAIAIFALPLAYFVSLLIFRSHRYAYHIFVMCFFLYSLVAYENMTNEVSKVNTQFEQFKRQAVDIAAHPPADTPSPGATEEPFAHLPNDTKQQASDSRAISQLTAEALAIATKEMKLLSVSMAPYSENLIEIQTAQLLSEESANAAVRQRNRALLNKFRNSASTAKASYSRYLKAVEDGVSAMKAPDNFKDSFLAGFRKTSSENGLPPLLDTEIEFVDTTNRIYDIFDRNSESMYFKDGTIYFDNQDDADRYMALLKREQELSGQEQVYLRKVAEVQEKFKNFSIEDYVRGSKN